MIPTRHRPGRLRSFSNRYSRRRKIVVAAVLLAAVAVIIPVATYASYARTIADPERLMNHNNTGIVLLDKKGEVFYSRGVVKNIKQVKLSQISPDVPKALLASEDADFYSEPGFSIKSIVRAVFSNFSSGDLTGSGGSTITQQLVKNNLLTSNKNLLRKYQEISMAVAIDKRYTKDQILELYLNSVYFGNDSFGIESAARSYFGKSAKDLDLAQSSILIGLLPAPTGYSPITGDEKLAKKRQNYVLTRMVEEKNITPAQKQATLTQKLTYVPVATPEAGNAQHFALMTLAELSKKYGEERIARSGLRVTTTLDLNLQKTAEATVAKQIKSLSSLNTNNASLVAIDPKTGSIKALVGSVDYNNTVFGKVNMATAPRQPGSSFKPIYYTEALAQKKITAASVLKDEPTDFGGGYKPTNYDLRYHGNVTARRALAESMNIPAVEVMQKVGLNQSVSAAQRLGISTINDPNKYGLSLALGTAEAKLMDMTNAYAALANGGDQFQPVLISEVKNKFGDTVFSNKPKAKQVMNQGATYIMSSILSDERARFPLAGNKLSIGRPVAVKTGTTNDNKDAWTIGYTPSIVVGVWVGNNDSTPMKGVGGTLGAGPIWKATISSYVKGATEEQFTPPKDIVKVQVCNAAGSYSEYFVKGTETEFTCDTPKYNPSDQPKKVEREDTEQKPTADETAPTDNPTTPTSAGGAATQPTPTPTTGSGSGTSTPTEPSQPTETAPAPAPTPTAAPSPTGTAPTTTTPSNP
ncbi:penicillin-binding protein [Polaromonas sp.]|nr:penicillin-binding protein [Candidatus Saccharibacteria bacterium]